MKIHLYTFLVMSFWLPALTLAQTRDCGRDCLIGIASEYLDALAANVPEQAPLADNISFVENITHMLPGEGTWATTENVSETYRIFIADPVQSSIGVMTIIHRQTADGVSPALLGLRLKVENGEITEAEHLVDEVPPIVDMASLQAPRVPMTTAVPERERMDRETLGRVAEGYYEALDRSDSSLGAFAADCERQENGMITAAYYLEPDTFEQVDLEGNPPPAVARDCIGQLDSRRFAYIDSIDDRRLVAIDPVNGLVMGFSHFRQSMANGPHRMIAADGSVLMWEEKRDPYDLPAVHVFKITEGQIHEVEAIGIFVPYNSALGWQ